MTKTETAPAARLTKKQAKKLASLSKRQKVSQSEVIRRLIEAA
jgi:hypothetical protein